MEWLLALLVSFGSLLLLLMVGMPVAFAFALINIVGVFLLWGGISGLEQLILSINTSVASFTLVPVPMFILMGEVMFHSGVGSQMMDALDKWIGRVPGRLALLAVAGGTLFASLTGSAMGSVAMLGSVLSPEMERRGYQKSMSLGPILGSGGLAIMIPPSALGAVLATLAEFSIGKFLVAIIIPGLLLATVFAAYIVLRCKLQPHIAPPYDIPSLPLREKTMALLRYVVPLFSVVFLVIGLILLGVASPTEAAALGALGCFLLAWAYRKLPWEVLKKSVAASLSITVMILMIITGSVAFSQVLAFSGASRVLTELVVSLPVPPIVILIMMQLVLLVLGCFIDQVSIMMITIPIFMPIVHTLGWDPVWFGAIFLLNMEVAAITPPFGVSLFVMRGVGPRGTTMADIYRAVVPFVLLNLLVMAMMIIYPPFSLWLPSMMRR